MQEVKASGRIFISEDIEIQFPVQTKLHRRGLFFSSFFEHNSLAQLKSCFVSDSSCVYLLARSKIIFCSTWVCFSSSVSSNCLKSENKFLRVFRTEPFTVNFSLSRVCFREVLSSLCTWTWLQQLQVRWFRHRNLFTVFFLNISSFWLGWKSLAIAASPSFIVKSNIKLKMLDFSNV